MTSSLVLDLFHGKHYGAILGFLEIGSGLGGTIGPWLSGFLFDRTQSYTVSFSLSMACSGGDLSPWCPPVGRAAGRIRAQLPSARIVRAAACCQSSRCRDLRHFRTYLEDCFFANLHRSRWRITRLGHVSRTRARYRHKPGCPGFTMIGGDGGGVLQCGAVGISSGACQQHDMAARHPADVEPPIVRSGNVQAELVVVRIGTADQNLSNPRAGCSGASVCDRPGVWSS